MADSVQLGGALFAAVSTFLTCFLLYMWKPSPNIQSLQNRHVLITGGSSGIGLEIAKEALAQGSYVTLIARNASKLKRAVEEILEEVQCESNKINVKVADVRDSGAIFAAINESFQWRPIDVLVCNAGVGYPSYIDQVSIESIDATVGTNLVGTLYSLRVALPLMKQRSLNHPMALVLMGSLFSLCPLYGGVIYSTTKYALKGLAENLRFELLPYNIRVSLICPGYVETPMLTQMEDDLVDNPTLAEIGRRVAFYDRSKAEDPRDVARATLKAAKQGTSLVVCEWKARMLATLSTGILPADSFARAVLDMVAFVPIRLIGYLIIGYAYAVIWLNHRTKSTIVKVGGDK